MGTNKQIGITYKQHCMFPLMLKLLRPWSMTMLRFMGGGVCAGEYAMLKAAALNGWLNEEDAVLEALLGMRRAGAELILSYYATDAAKWMNK